MKSLPPALLTARQSAEYLGVSKTYFSEREAAAYLGISPRFFRAHVRPMITRLDFRPQGSDRPMWRYTVAELDRWADSRTLRKAG